MIHPTTFPKFPGPIHYFFVAWFAQNSLILWVEKIISDIDKDPY